VPFLERGLQEGVLTFEADLLTHVFSVRNMYNKFCKILSILEEDLFLGTPCTAVLTLMFSVELVPHHSWRLASFPPSYVEKSLNVIFVYRWIESLFLELRNTNAYRDSRITK
jgi:hypothetical protein